MSDLPALDLVIVGAGFSGLYMLHRARGPWPVRPRAGGGRRRGRHLVLEPLPGCALRRREHAVLLPVLGRAPAGVGVDRAVREPARDPQLPQSRGRPVRPPPRHPVRRPGAGGRRSTRRRGAGWSAPTRASRCQPGSWSWRPAACRRPTSPTSPAWTASPARPSTPGAGRMSPLTSRDSGWGSSAPARQPFSRSPSSPGRPASWWCSSGRPPIRCLRRTSRSARRSSRRSRPTTRGSASGSA